MKRLLYLLLSFILCFGLSACSSNTKKAITVSSLASTPTKELSPTSQTETTYQEDPLKKWINIGFSESESLDINTIFTNLGITEIGTIESVSGTGINELQSFRTKIFGTSNLQVNFTVEKRMLCYVEIAGLSGPSQSVTMYDKWNDDGVIDNSKTGYMNKLIFESKEIVPY